jgi:hypothetical protein
MKLADYALECNIDINQKFISEKTITQILDQLIEEHSGNNKKASKGIT